MNERPASSLLMRRKFDLTCEFRAIIPLGAGTLRARTMSKPTIYHYLPVSDQAVEWGFYVTSAGRILEPVAPGLPYGEHPAMSMFDWTPAPEGSVATRSSRASGRILPDFSVIYITDTHALFESDGTGIVEFDAPTLLFLFPGNKLFLQSCVPEYIQGICLSIVRLSSLADLCMSFMFRQDSDSRGLW